MFFIGSKRSGTSLLVRILNRHPRIFVTHESDLIWILYNKACGKPAQPYFWDGEAGWRATMAACGSLFAQKWAALSATHTISDLFFEMTRHLMRNGSEVQDPHPNKTDLLWMGDKKPRQCGDPYVFSFIEKHFSRPRYLHLVRHPRAHISSSLRFFKEQAGFYQSRPDVLAETWVMDQRHAEAVKESVPERVHTILYEDLCREPIDRVASCLAFLGLDMTEEMEAYLVRTVEPGYNDKHQDFDLTYTKAILETMIAYGYEPD